MRAGLRREALCGAEEGESILVKVRFSIGLEEIVVFVTWECNVDVVFRVYGQHFFFNSVIWVKRNRTLK